MKNEKLLIFLIAVFAALPPFAIDTYSPAIPSIAHYFAVAKSATMITYTTYFIGYSIGIVIWGALSDVFGRKKILIIGVILYIFSTSICSISVVFWQLFSARMFQGFGDAACTTVAFAILRDCYDGKRLTKAMSSVGMIMMFAPIIAPIIGASIIDISNDWRLIFHFLTAYGVVLFLLSFVTPETNLNRYKLSDIYQNYKSHIKNRKFIILSAATAFSFASLFSFIGSSAIIYISIYNVSRLNYAFLFGVNATSILIANLLLKKLIDHINLVKIQILSISAGLIVLLIGIILISLVPNNLLLYILLMWCVTFCIAISSNSMMSEAMHTVKNSFGVAVSISTFIKFMLAGVANYVITLFAYYHLNQIVLIQQFIIFVIVALLYFYSRKIRS